MSKFILPAQKGDELFPTTVVAPPIIRWSGSVDPQSEDGQRILDRCWSAIMGFYSQQNHNHSLSQNQQSRAAQQVAPDVFVTYVNQSGVEYLTIQIGAQPSKPKKDPADQVAPPASPPVTHELDRPATMPAACWVPTAVNGKLAYESLGLDDKHGAIKYEAHSPTDDQYVPNYYDWAVFPYNPVNINLGFTLKLYGREFTSIWDSRQGAMYLDKWEYVRNNTLRWHTSQMFFYNNYGIQPPIPEYAKYDLFGEDGVYIGPDALDYAQPRQINVYPYWELVGTPIVDYYWTWHTRPEYEDISNISHFNQIYGYYEATPSPGRTHNVWGTMDHDIITLVPYRPSVWGDGINFFTLDTATQLYNSNGNTTYYDPEYKLTHVYYRRGLKQFGQEKEPRRFVSIVHKDAAFGYKYDATHAYESPTNLDAGNFSWAGYCTYEVTIIGPGASPTGENCPAYIGFSYLDTLDVDFNVTYSPRMSGSWLNQYDKPDGFMFRLDPIYPAFAGMYLDDFRQQYGNIRCRSIWKVKGSQEVNIAPIVRNKQFWWQVTDRGELKMLGPSDPNWIPPSF